jgi:hypothetical protein
VPVAIFEETSVRSWTNDDVIQRWSEFPREVLDAMEPDGDFGRRHLLNPTLLRLLGDVPGQRINSAAEVSSPTRWKILPGGLSCHDRR